MAPDDHKTTPPNGTGARGKKKKGEANLVTLPHMGTNTSHRQVEVVTIGAEEMQNYKPSPHTTPNTSFQKKTSFTWKDELLKKCNGKGGTKISWRPGSDRHVSDGPDSYKPFTHITRTLHLHDALDVCIKGRMEPKNITSFSCIDSRDLPANHPCAGLKVLWFGARFNGLDENLPDWYGNVQFSVEAKLLLENWKYFYLVEMMTTPTHTCSRILVTNTDYSHVLPTYNHVRPGGPWRTTSEGQLALSNCTRYRFRGHNAHEHILEFMINATPQDEKRILQNCKISFRNHEAARDLRIRHVCNRHQRAGTPCPTPFPRSVTATNFFSRLQQLNIDWHTGIPRLSESALKFLEEYQQQQPKNFPQQQQNFPLQQQNFQQQKQQNFQQQQQQKQNSQKQQQQNFQQQQQNFQQQQIVQHQLQQIFQQQQQQNFQAAPDISRILAMFPGMIQYVSFQ